MSYFDITDTLFNTGLEITGIITTVSGAHSIGKVHYVNEYQSASLIGLKFQSGSQLAFIKESDLPSDVVNGASTIKINNISYYINEVQIEEGVCTLILTLN